MSSFTLRAATPSRNKYSGMAGGLNSVNPNWVLDNLTVLDSITVNTIAITGMTGVNGYMSVSNLIVQNLTGGTGYFANFTVNNSFNTTNLVISGTLFYTGTITGSFNVDNATNFTATGALVTNITGTTSSFTTATISQTRITSMTAATGIATNFTSTNYTGGNSTITNMTGTNLYISKLVITGANPQFILSTGGSNFDWYETGTISMTGIQCCTGTYTGIRYSRTGRNIVLNIPTTSDLVQAATAWVWSALPIKLRPINDVYDYNQVLNNLITGSSHKIISTAGLITFYTTATSTGFSTGAAVIGNGSSYLAP